ncbi:prefoldin subunit [Chitinophaga solisilvae]|uniref:prefoldin subunit n=1 Tax=Chitinophaga solisilvae TaxID=1233460 RepID=UPI00136CA58E|nr:prefoldin subunit [Chitinophaga solisilvae]
MKTSIVVLLCLLLFLPVCIMAQKKQSAIYDAIQFYNARHQQLEMPVPVSANVILNINPLTGKEVTTEERDALLKQKDSSSVSIIRAILIRNAGLPPNATNTDILLAYKDNPFLEHELCQIGENNCDKNIHDDFAGAYPVPNELSTKSGAWGANLTANIANGVADFLIQRAQEEINVAVFQRIKKILDKYPEFNILFPETYKLIGPIEAYNYAATLKALKDAVHNDVKGLMGHVASLYALPKYKVLNNEVPELTPIFALTQLVAELNNDAGPSQVISRISSAAYVQEPHNNYAAFMQLAGKLSDGFLKQRLGQPDDKNYKYFTPDDLAYYSKNKPTVMAGISKIFMGLIYQQLGELSFYGNGQAYQVKDVLTPYANQTSLVVNNLLTAVTALDAANAALEKIRTDENQYRFMNPNKDLDRIKQYGIVLQQWLELASPFISLPPDNASAACQQFVAIMKEIRVFYLPTATSTLNIISQIEQKQYNLAVYQLAELFKLVNNYLEAKMELAGYRENLQKELDSTGKAVATLAENVIVQKQKEINILKKTLESKDANGVRQHVQSRIILLEAQLKELSAQKEKITAQLPKAKNILYQLPVLIEYTNLLVSLGEAENAEQVKQLLNATALPSGSSRIKKKTIYNLAVNGYVGWFMRSEDNTGGDGFTNTYGITAPVGLSLSTGFGKAGSASLFTGIIDVGAVVRYKLDEQGKYQQNVSIGNILSPSVQLVYGFPWYLPFSLGLGCQWSTPAEVAMNKIELKPHFNLFIAVDIPLYNLASRKKLQYAGYQKNR